MLNRFQGWRERGWSVVDSGTYADAWQRFGGSVATHPMVVERLAQLAGIPVRYLAWEQDGKLKAAIPTWGRDLALSKDVLKRHGKKGLFDLGNAELILPAAADAAAPLRHRARYLSQLNEGRFSNLLPQAEQLAMARTPEELSKKFRYNQRRELRLLEEAGGVVRPVSEFSSVELASIYCDLFLRRWGFVATGAERMAEVIELLRELLIGSVIFLNDAPIAIQLVYRAESPEWISVEYVNGGVDPQTREFSPGSVLSFLNTQSAWEQARNVNKPLRFSFGRADREYKERWCNPVPVFKVWNTNLVGADLLAMVSLRFLTSRSACIANRFAPTGDQSQEPSHEPTRLAQTATSQASSAQQAYWPADRPAGADCQWRVAGLVVAAGVGGAGLGGP